MASFAIVAPLRVRAGFRLDDGLGRDRKARANRRRAVFGDDVTHKVNPPRDDLLDGPSRRVGRRRASVSPSHEASRARTSRLREAKSPTLGLLDGLSERAARSARRLAAGPNGANTKPPSDPSETAASARADTSYSASSFAAAARWTRRSGADWDVFDVPRARARTGETSSRTNRNGRAFARAAFAQSSRRGDHDAAAAGSRLAPKRDRTPPRHQRRVLGLLTGPSARVGRAARRGAAGGDGTRDRKQRERGPYRAGADAAGPLLGILSGPGKRVGRKGK